jgi:hypothetical protein
VAWLGLSELKPLVQQAFLRGSIDPGWLRFKDFEEDLQYTIDHPDAEPLHSDGELTLFGDTVADVGVGWFQAESAEQRHFKLGIAGFSWDAPP